MLYFHYSYCIFHVWKTFFLVYGRRTGVESLCWLNRLLEIWRVMHFVGFLFAFLEFPRRKEKSRAREIWKNGANMMCGLAIYIGGFRTVLLRSFQCPVDSCLSNSFFHSFSFSDLCLAVFASRKVCSMAGGTTAVIAVQDFVSWWPTHFANVMVERHQFLMWLQDWQLKHCMVLLWET